MFHTEAMPRLGRVRVGLHVQRIAVSISQVVVPPFQSPSNNRPFDFPDPPSPRLCLIIGDRADTASSVIFRHRQTGSIMIGRSSRLTYASSAPSYTSTLSCLVPSCIRRQFWKSCDVRFPCTVCRRVAFDDHFGSHAPYDSCVPAYRLQIRPRTAL
jgi:hypothetical protein